MPITETITGIIHAAMVCEPTSITIVVYSGIISPPTRHRLTMPGSGRVDPEIMPQFSTAPLLMKKPLLIRVPNTKGRIRNVLIAHFYKTKILFEYTRTLQSRFSQISR